MGLSDVSETLRSCMEATLDVWSARFTGERESLYWVLRAISAQAAGASPVHLGALLERVPADLAGEVRERLEETRAYWDNIRYASLDRVTQLWGTVVNALRADADSPIATDAQKRVFAFPADSLVALFRAARERMEVADQLHHAFKPMPAPECQALAALCNVHVDAPLDVDLMRRLVRLLDGEGPLSEAESADLATLSNTSLVDATFRGSRGD